MSISRIENKQAGVPPDHGKSGDSRHEQPVVKKINYDQDVSGKKISGRHLEGMKKIHDRSVEMIADYIAHIKSQSETVVKFFPPFEAGSEERVKMLLNFAAFRNLIERLTIPPSASAEETEAELKSIEIKKTLTNNLPEGLTQARSRFAEYFDK